MDFENFGDYIYLIILVVLSIIGAITKKKKNAEAPVETSGDTLFESLFNNDEDEEDYAPERINRKAFVEEKPVVAENKEQSMYRFRKGYKEDVNLYSTKSRKDAANKVVGTEISDEISKQNAIKSTEIGKASPSVQLNTGDREELKKGIIYSEILKPKYVNW